MTTTTATSETIYVRYESTFEEWVKNHPGYLQWNNTYLFKNIFPELDKSQSNRIHFEYKNILCTNQVYLSNPEDDEKITKDEFMRIVKYLRDIRVPQKNIIFKCDDKLVEIKPFLNYLYATHHVTEDWIWEYLDFLPKAEYSFIMYGWKLGDPIPHFRGFNYDLRFSQKYSIFNGETITLYSPDMSENIEYVEHFLLEFGEDNKAVVLPEYSGRIINLQLDSFIDMYRNRVKLVIGVNPPRLNQEQYQNLFYVCPDRPLMYPINHYRGVHANHYNMRFLDRKLFCSGFIPETYLNNCTPNIVLVDGVEEYFDTIVVRTTSTSGQLWKYKQALINFNYHIIYEMSDQDGVTLSWASLVHKPKFSEPYIEKWYNDENIEQLIRINKQNCELKDITARMHLQLSELPDNVTQRIMEFIGGDFNQI